MPRLTIPEEKLSAFCRKRHIRRLSLFGSTLSGQAHPDSDVDLPVEFEPGREPGLIGLAAMEEELRESFSAGSRRWTCVRRGT